MNIYEDIAKRTNGEIYIGVVGPVRCGKSTFVKKFMDNVVIPNIDSEYDKKRALDETPQSASGRTIMTTEPKFVPDEAVSVSIGDSSMRVRLIDCVGYMVDGAIGAEENGEMRMVLTPWDKEPVEFEKAAEIGTKKVITDHSTVGIVLTTDGTIGEISRESYISAEKRVINELKAIKKPFVIVLNSAKPNDSDTVELAISLEKEYNAPVALVNALELENEDFEGIIKLLLGQFGINELRFNLPKYLSTLEDNHPLKQSILNSIKSSLDSISKIDDVEAYITKLTENKNISGVPSINCDLGCGIVDIGIKVLPELYYSIISEICGLDITDDADLFSIIKELAESKKEYDKFADAINDVNETGYGIVLPQIDDMTLNEPETVRHSGAYGIKINANAPSIHLIKAPIEAEVCPIVGTIEQAEEIVKLMQEEYDDDPSKLWEFNMLGKSLFELVNDSLTTKLEHISMESRKKLSDTLTRVINEGSKGLICIIL
jgi:stage IV sporulation protein A